MKVNNLTSNSFRGLYIVKGSGKEVTEVVTKICKKTSNPSIRNFVQFIESNQGLKGEAEKTIDNFKNCNIDILTGVYSAKQPLVQALVATNDDVAILENYYSNLYGVNAGTNFDELDEVHMTIFKNRVAKILKKNAEKFVEYDEAYKKFLNTGEAYSLSNFILKQAINAKKKLAEILSPFNIKEENLSSLNASKVLQAIKADGFDYINGKFTI